MDAECMLMPSCVVCNAGMECLLFIGLPCTLGFAGHHGELYLQLKRHAIMAHQAAETPCSYGSTGRFEFECKLMSCCRLDLHCWASDNWASIRLGIKLVQTWPKTNPGPVQTRPGPRSAPGHGSASAAWRTCGGRSAAAARACGLRLCHGQLLTTRH